MSLNLTFSKETVCIVKLSSYCIFSGNWERIVKWNWVPAFSQSEWITIAKTFCGIVYYTIYNIHWRLYIISNANKMQKQFCGNISLSTVGTVKSCNNTYVLLKWFLMWYIPGKNNSHFFLVYKLYYLTVTVFLDITFSLFRKLFFPESNKCLYNQFWYFFLKIALILSLNSK